MLATTVNVLKIWTLVACQKGLDKQGRPRPDCFFRSSLVWVFRVCYSDKHFVNSTPENKFQNIYQIAHRMAKTLHQGLYGNGKTEFQDYSRTFFIFQSSISSQFCKNALFSAGGVELKRCTRFLWFWHRWYIHIIIIVTWSGVLYHVEWMRSYHRITRDA